MPSTAMLLGGNAICSQCHEAGTPGAKAAVQMAQWIDGLDSALTRSEAVLTSADKYGMEVSEAQLRLIEGRENVIKARLTMHGFKTEEMRKPIEAGMAIARETRRAGEAALKEKDNRRLGLAVSVFFIALTIAAIWFLIRHLEASGVALPGTSGSE